jgi:MFS family permease
MSGLTMNYITPYALTMQASIQQIGYLSSIPNFANMLVLFIAPFLSERTGSRKSLVLPAVLVQALMWLPILAIPFVFHSNQVWWLIAFITLSTAAGSLSGPPWSAMMADLIPMELRGRYPRHTQPH